MKLAIMQPYLFPYLGYFQLIHAVDTFVIFDDVNYINKGWINRNRILVNGMEHLFTLQLNKASQNVLINEISAGENGRALLKTIELAYKKAPHFKAAFPIVERVLLSEEKKLHRLIGHSLVQISGYLGIETEFRYSSEIEKDNALRAQARIINLCEVLNAGTYINPINGRDLYSREEFEQHQIELYFLQTGSIHYRHCADPFVPWLSIIDVMMHNSASEISTMLNNYSLV
jgi:hypothetical protein